VKPKTYILNDAGEPVAVNSIIEWVEWYDQAQRRVRFDTIGGYEVSTAFLGTDHNWGPGPPVLWETMVFGDGPLNEECDRCSGSREQAEAMHEAMLDRVREAKEKPPTPLPDAGG
jgi:hypothetical protein